jgi:hypothetical protein
VDVPVPGTRERRRDAERQEGVRELVGELLGGVDGGVEQGGRLDQVVGRGDDHGRRRVLPGDQGGPKPDGRRRVPAERLADQVVGRQLRQLAPGLADVGGPGDDPRPVGRHLGGQPVERPLEQGPVAGEAEELLRPAGPAAGPEPGPAAAGHDHRVEHDPFP